MVDHSNSFLDLKVIWKDDHMFELQVKVQMAAIQAQPRFTTLPNL